MTQPEPIANLARLTESSIDTLQERCDGYERMWRNSAESETKLKGIIQFQALTIRDLNNQITVLKAKMREKSRKRK